MKVQFELEVEVLSCKSQYFQLLFEGLVRPGFEPVVGFWDGVGFGDESAVWTELKVGRRNEEESQGLLWVVGRKSESAADFWSGVWSYPFRGLSASDSSDTATPGPV